MAHYYYRALDGEGEVQVGSLDATDLPAATASLHSRGWLPVELSSSGKTLAMRLNEPVHLFGKPGDREVQAFLRDLSRLLKAGLSVDDALKLQLDMQENELFLQVLSDIRERVRRGESLSASLSIHSEYFSIQVIAAVQAGEHSGALADGLDTIASAMDKSLSFQERLRSALIYPAILMVGVCATFVLVVTFVLPQFAPLFEGNADKLPWSTQFVMGLAAFFSENWQLLALAWGALLVWAFVAWHNPAVKSAMLEKASKLPGFRSWMVTPDIIRFLRTIGVCSQSGMPLDKAIAMAIDAVKMPHLGAALGRSRAQVRGGDYLSVALEKHEWFPPLALQFARVGEQSGNLGSMLEESATILAQDFEARLEKSLAVLSPVLTLVMGGIVALLVGSVLLGIMSINDVAL